MCSSYFPFWELLRQSMRADGAQLAWPEGCWMKNLQMRCSCHPWPGGWTMGKIALFICFRVDAHFGKRTFTGFKHNTCDILWCLILFEHVWTIVGITVSKHVQVVGYGWVSEPPASNRCSWHSCWSKACERSHCSFNFLGKWFENRKSLVDH